MGENGSTGLKNAAFFGESAKNEDTESTIKMSEAQPTKKYKDTVFRDLFKIPENMLELCRALLQDNDIKQEDVKDSSLSEALYRKQRNDLAIQCDTRSAVIFSEHQSTINQNMPIRFLVYTGREYERRYAGDELYKEQQVMLDKPYYYVFYNGKKDTRAEYQMRLSDAFINGDRYGNSLEITVRVYNLHKLDQIEGLRDCEVLYEYQKFIDTIEKYREDGHTVNEAVKKAIGYCIKNGILVDYLKSRGAEVYNMMTAEYDEEIARSVLREESKQEGIKEGMERGKQEGMERGMERVNLLTSILIREGKTALLVKSLNDPALQKRLMEEYHI